MESTVLDFPRGVTGIVGPNGCGKSNIVDALRWVLGEQSAKHLRGQSMDDVIFAGNERYAQLGFAEVSITLDTDGPLPTIAEPESGDEQASVILAALKDAPEIEVTRRLFRSGESEYLINGRACRLRDITELFLGTGVGTKAYSIIEQGRVGQIVNAKPDEIRLFIEEAAGTTLYRSRKLAAERKIERTKSNLLRVSDIVSELDRQAASLRRQVRGAVRYGELKGEELALDRALARVRFRTLRERRQELDVQLEALRSQEHVARETARAVHDSRDAVRQRQVSGAQESDEARREYYEVRGRLTALAQEQQFLEQRRTELSASRDATVAEMESIVASLGLVRVATAAAANERNECERQRESLTAAAASEEARLAERDLAVTTAAGELERYRTRSLAALAEEVRLANECSALTRQREAIGGRLTRLREEESSLGTLSQQLIGLIQQSRGRLDDIVIEIDSATGGKNAAARRVGDLASSRRGAEQLAEQRRNDVASLESRYHSLKELSEGFAEYGEGVRRFMRNGGHEATGASAVVAEVIDIDSGFERAVAAVLDDRLQCVVVPTADDGLRGATYLRETDAGRASFIPMKPPREIGERDEKTAPPTGWTWLREHVRVKPGYEAPVFSLLEGVAVGSSLGSVVSEWRSSGCQSTLVTTEGEVLEPTGIVTGGSGRPAEEGLLARKAELRGIRIKLVDVEVKAREARAAFERISRESEEGEKILGDFDRRLHELTVARVGAEAELELQRQNLSRTRDRAVSLATEIDSLVREEAQLREQCESLRAQAAQVALERQAIDDDSRRLEAERRTLEEEREKARIELASARIREAALGQRVESALQRSENALAQQQDLENRYQALEERRLRDAMELEAVCARLDDPTLRIDRLEDDLKAASSRSERLEALVGESRAALARLERELDDLSRGIEAIRDERSGIELALKECELERGSIESGLRERLGIGEADLLTDESASSSSDERDALGLGEELERVRAAIRRLGAVNVGAVAELEEIDSRLRELVAQRDDLERSIEDLRGTISQLNRLSRQRFKDTFDKVNEIFHETFPRLFHGGKAWLAMTDEANLLETGVEIFVQPPGKKLGNIDLLSGGEKALTAVSLIFSLFLHKPSPFCVLDEVDAPLDDANIGRFARMVDEMSTRSQFLLITHNKKTMESCDTLYGVTMREPGVSKIVSVELSHGTA
jgi:chromosome segregation protein